jgi:rRNA pseudouridine-1189 N-methylase Emg1 (Nep1/Mra1 family)
MEEQSTILLRKDIIEILKKAREHPRQTYNELIEKMAKIFIKMKERNQYDEFLHKIQQPKMKELWDNKEDEIWDNV